MPAILDPSIFAVFVATFFFVSATPGMCMTLSMSLGMTIGLKRTLWMMLGELTGVGLVAALAGVGVATIMLNYPLFFQIFKYIGGAYLGYLGIQLWLSRGKLAISENLLPQAEVAAASLALHGFVTAVANPKGWAFFIALLPPFINQQQPLAPQLAVLLSLILTIEFLCLLLYAAGGRSLNRLLKDRSNVRLVNRIAGVLMMGVGIWLALG